MTSLQAAAQIAAKIVSSVSKMGKVLVKSLKVGAPPVKISLPTMAMDVRKDTSKSLVRKQVESPIGGCKIEGVLEADDDDCISAQVMSAFVCSETKIQCSTKLNMWTLNKTHQAQTSSYGDP